MINPPTFAIPISIESPKCNSERIITAYKVIETDKDEIRIKNQSIFEELDHFRFTEESFKPFPNNEKHNIFRKGVLTPQNRYISYDSPHRFEPDLDSPVPDTLIIDAKIQDAKLDLELLTQRWEARIVEEKHRQHAQMSALLSQQHLEMRELDKTYGIATQKIEVHNVIDLSRKNRVVRIRTPRDNNKQGSFEYSIARKNIIDTYKKKIQDMNSDFMRTIDLLETYKEKDLRIPSKKLITLIESKKEIPCQVSEPIAEIPRNKARYRRNTLLKNVN